MHFVGYSLIVKFKNEKSKRGPIFLPQYLNIAERQAPFNLSRSSLIWKSNKKTQLKDRSQREYLHKDSKSLFNTALPEAGRSSCASIKYTHNEICIQRMTF